MTSTLTAPCVAIRGHGGLFAGVDMTLVPGETVVVGRSRTCDVSLLAPGRRAHASQLGRVSRIHCEIECLKAGDVEIRDLSRNGTLVDGVRVGRTHLFRLDGGRATVELIDGTWGKLLLSETDGSDE